MENTTDTTIAKENGKREIGKYVDESKTNGCILDDGSSSTLPEIQTPIYLSQNLNPK